MAQLPSAFNSNDHEEMGDFSAMPAGDYQAEITESKRKESKTTAGNFYWELTFKIIGGKFNGRTTWTRLNLINSDAAVEIANQELTSICKAVGKVSIGDTTELHKIPMTITLKIDAATAQYSASNSITKYARLAGVATPDAPGGGSEEHAPKRTKAWEQ